MKHKYSLARRIITGFVVLAVMTGGFYATVSMVLMHVMEKQLLSTELSIDLDNVLTEIARGKKIELEKNKYFYTNTMNEEMAIPPWLRALKPGFHEVFNNGNAYYAWVRKIHGGEFVILRDQGNFEKHEKRIQVMMLVAFLASLLIAWWLGHWLAHKVIEPVTRLARQVGTLDQMRSPVPLANDYANDEVGQLAATLDGAFSQLQQALQRERLFTSDVSHELRTPLMVIGSSCELLLAASQTDQRTTRQLQQIAKACVEMQELVHTFLQMARTSNDFSDISARVTLAELAQDERAVWEPQASAKGLSFVLRVDGEDTGHYHRALLRAVVNNLLRNAMHYTDQGEVRLVLEQGALRVEDTGVGIPEAQRDLMFEPFVRGTEERGDGVGLGLSLVQRICVQQGWTVTLTPLQPSGCSFRVTLTS